MLGPDADIVVPGREMSVNGMLSGSSLIQSVTGGYADSPLQITGTREALRDEAAAKSDPAKKIEDAIKALKVEPHLIPIPRGERLKRVSIIS